MEVLGAAEPQAAGRYRLIAELGRGGMGRVLLGAGPDGRLVAVKQVRTQFVEDTGFLARFRREVAASRKVPGAYTAAIVDADVDGPVPWLASVFVPGPSLQDAVDVAGVLPEQAALRLAAGLASALMEIHRAGLVHRDLKPSNVLLAADGPRVIDFGIARALDGDGTELTHTGWLIGSPGFMSPEQAEGHELTTASDVFSLGSVLVMACTGASPFAGTSTPRTLYNLVHTEPDLTAVPAAVRAIAERCLAKDPADRPTPAGLLESIGGLTPSTTPWPPAVHRLIESQHAEVARVLAGTPAEPVDGVDGNGDRDTVAATTTMPMPARTPDPEPDDADADTVAVATQAVRVAGSATARPVRRRLLIGALALLVVAATVAGVIVWSPWSQAGSTGELIALDGHTDMTAELTFSPDGRLLATGSNDRTVRLWDVAARREVARLAQDDYVRAIDFSPDGRLLAVATGSTVHLWDVATRKEDGRLHPPYVISDVDFSPDGRLLAIATGSTVRLWDMTTRQQAGTHIDTGQGDVASIAFSPDGQLLASVGNDAGGGPERSAFLWHVASREQSGAPITLREYVDVAVFSPDGRTLAVGSRDGVTSLWDVRDRRRVGQLSGTGDGLVFSVAFSEDGRTVATVGHGLHLWHLAEHEQFANPVTDTLGVAFSPDNRTVATGTGKGRVWLYVLPDS